MTEINTTLTERFSAFCLPQPDGTRHEILENATLGDLHSVIDWIATYKITLNGIKCPVSNTNNTIATASSWLSGSCKTPKACGLFELMPQICAVYVHGGSAGAKVSVQSLHTCTDSSVALAPFGFRACELHNASVLDLASVLSSTHLYCPLSLPHLDCILTLCTKYLHRAVLRTTCTTTA
jgi:hypothetical protein